MHLLIMEGEWQRRCTRCQLSYLSPVCKVNRVQDKYRAELDMAGFTLVDCPSRNMKESAAHC